MKQCQECKEEISSTDKVCPHCGRDQKYWFNKNKILTFLGVIIFLGIISSALVTRSNGTKVIKTDIDVFKSDYYEIKITSIEEKSQVGKLSPKRKPQEGYTYVVVNYQFINISGKPLSQYESPDFVLIDKNKAKYAINFNGSYYYREEKSLDKFLDFDFNPGITYTSAYVFEIPEKQFKAGGWNLIVNEKTARFGIFTNVGYVNIN
jgi:hypothetical protein